MLYQLIFVWLQGNSLPPHGCLVCVIMCVVCVLVYFEVQVHHNIALELQNNKCVYVLLVNNF